MEIVKNGGALQRLVANKYIGEKKKPVISHGRKARNGDGKRIISELGSCPDFPNHNIYMWTAYHC